jgi:hypothetical protein
MSDNKPNFPKTPIWPERRRAEKEAFDRAEQELMRARQDQIDRARQTGEMPGVVSEMFSDIPEKLSFWYFSGPMQPMSPTMERSYFREQADKKYQQELRRAIEQSRRQRSSGWDGAE